MKKLIYSFLALAMVATTFSCEDVPAPYDYGYDGPGKDTTKVITVDPAGDGTLASPYNVARALELINNGTYTSDKVYIKGIVNGTPDIDTGYGNAVYYLADVAGNATQLEVYRGYSYNGEKFTATDEIKDGDVLIIKGVLTLFKTTPEVTTGSQIVSINGVTKEPTTPEKPATGEPKGSGTEADPYNVAGIIAAAQKLSADDKVKDVYVSGIISQVKDLNTKYGEINYYISDDGKTDTQFYVYNGYGLNGAKFTSLDELKVGQKVKIVGTLINYKGNTPEFQYGSKILSLE